MPEPFRVRCECLAKPKTGVALYGLNGHQIHSLLADHPRARLVALAEFDRARLPEALRDDPAIKTCASLEELTALPEVELVVLCSPRRRDQARHAVECLARGKHVYAEKPAAFSERELDEILLAARRHDRRFHEMAGTAFDQPWLALRERCRAGELGEIFQVFAQKSYPYHDRRPQDEDVDGGLLMQVGIHAVRLIEHISGLRAEGVSALETRAANPVPGGGLRMACAANLRLENGGIATFIANYGNSRKFPLWGNEEVRVFGSAGFIEAVNGGSSTHLYLNDEDKGPLPATGSAPDYFEQVLDDLREEGRPLLTLEEELHPLRVVIRARAAAHAGSI